MYSTEYELVLRLLERYFGCQVAKVGGYILLRGQVSLQKLVSQGHIDFEVLRNSIIILLHHGFLDYSVQFTQVGDRRISSVLYSVSCENVISNALLPFGCLLAKSELGPICYDLLLIVSKYGTISQRRLTELAVRTLSIGANEANSSIEALIAAGYLTNCETYAHRLTIAGLNTREFNSMNDPLAAMNAEIYHIMQGKELVGPDGHLLRANCSYIVNRLVKEEIVNLICRRVGDMPMVRAIMKVLMDNPRDEWPMLIEYAVLEQKVIQLLRKNGDQKSSGEQVLRLLNALNKHPDNLVKHDTVTHSYFLDWDKVKRMLRKKAILGCVRQLCGIKAARVWNLLASENEEGVQVAFDAHKVSTKALVSMQTARAILYQLTLRGLASHHETDAVNTAVPATSTSERHVLSFSANIESTYLQLVKVSYKFASNLIERLECENTKIFQSYFAVQPKSEGQDGSKHKECDIVEAHLLHLIKFVVIMQKL